VDGLWSLAWAGGFRSCIKGCVSVGVFWDGWIHGFFFLGWVGETRFFGGNVFKVGRRDALVGVGWCCSDWEEGDINGWIKRRGDAREGRRRLEAPSGRSLGYKV
jgi:hypothetical protein